MKFVMSFVVAVVVGLSATQSQAQDKPTYQSLWAEVTQKSDCKPAEYPDFTLVTCAKELTLWYFTKPNHPAHPGVIKRTIVQGSGGLDVREQGYSFASDAAQPAFKNWLAQIADLDRKMKEDMAKRHGSTDSQN
jgi:hypothetical protein